MANSSASHKGNGAVSATNGTSGMMAIYSRHWGPERSVQILRDPTKSLGISIVGGKVCISYSIFVFVFFFVFEFEFLFKLVDD